MAAAATAARTFTRTAFRFAPATATFRASATRTSTRITPLPRQAFRQQSRRGYADSASPNPNNTHTARGGIILGVGIAALGGASYYYYEKNPDVIEKLGFGGSGSTDKVFTPKFENYQEVYNAIAQALEEKDDYDDGSYGPVLLRLAWHASGTYDKETGTGGSNGATMRFDPEGDHGANAGLKAARDFLEPIKAQLPWISHSDLWTLAGVCAIQEMQGPTIPWRPGRQDRAVSFCTPDGRLPDGAKEQTHLRAIFGRMGFTDQEIVALSGAHALGRCHTDRSGFSGPWTFSPTVLTNDYYKLLVDERWQYKKWDGPRQFEDSATRSLMMLPTDMALVRDRKFRAHVERYARDNEAFFRDFGDVVMRLFELGVPFASGEEARWKFKPATGLD